MRIKHIVLSVSAGVALLFGATAGTAAAGETTGAPTVRGACPDTGNEVSISGGWAKWDITCEKGRVHVRGVVKDTALDGKCARVKATNMTGGKTKKVSACGWGTTKKINLDLGKGSKGALVYLYKS